LILYDFLKPGGLEDPRQWPNRLTEPTSLEQTGSLNLPVRDQWTWATTQVRSRAWSDVAHRSVLCVIFWVCCPPELTAVNRGPAWPVVAYRPARQPTGGDGLS